jgi:glycosyltransferase involved in cell wall biosynthesis
MRNNSTNPIVTVLMPVYNTEKYLKEAIDSILNQTLGDFEFIIIDDASTDASVSIVQSYIDSRIKLVIKPQNTGYTTSLNMGLEMAKGKYIARMDSDDISVLDRFEKQVVFMEEHDDVAVCGSWFKCIGTNEVIQHPATNDAIKVAFLSYCAIGHPTVMLRNSFLKEHHLIYNTDMEPAEDYDLWCRIVRIGKLANIPEVLLQYRLHNSQVSSLRGAKQRHISNQVKMSLLNLLILKPTFFQGYSIYEIEEIINSKKSFFEQINNRLKYLEKLELLNDIQQHFSVSLFKKFSMNQKVYWVKFYLLDNRAYSPSNLIIFFIRGKFFLNYMSLTDAFKYAVKCFTRLNKVTFS